MVSWQTIWPLVPLLMAPAAICSAPLDEPIKPVPLSLHQNPARVEIGRRLFDDTRLSASKQLACASCHDLAHGGVDSRGLSLGKDGRPVVLNAPTVFNAALNFKQFWNGRADTLEAQIDMVVQNPREMASFWPDVVRDIAQDDNYRRAFAAAYSDGVTKANIQNALASFERTLITPNSRFDQYLRGARNAISEDEKKGYARFKQYGCISCHQGVNVGGNMFQKFGVMSDYFSQRGAGSNDDQGRYLVTYRREDMHVFKVPGLRNVALTAPYFHDASAKTLEEAVDVMFAYQLGRVGSREDKQLIVKFLGTLTAAPAGQP